MEIKLQGIDQLLKIHDQLTEEDAAENVDGHLEEASGILGCLLNRGYTEEQSDHIISYCHRRMEYARSLVQHGEVEEGIVLAKSVIIYYSKAAILEDPAEKMTGVGNT